MSGLILDNEERKKMLCQNFANRNLAMEALTSEKTNISALLVF